MEKIIKGVYCRTFSNGKKYVGISFGKDGYLARIKRENNTAFNPNCGDYNTKLSRAIRKHGPNTKNEIILETDDVANMKRSEMYLIDLWNLLDDNFGYNISPGGDGKNKPGKKLSLEEKQIRKQKMIKLGTLDKVNENRKGVPRTEEVKQKIKLKTIESMKKVDMKNICSKRIVNEETKKNQRDYAKSCIGDKNPRYKKYTIINIKTGEIFSGGTLEIRKAKHVGVDNINNYGHSKNWMLYHTVEKGI